ncbi:double-stranded RNA-binding protein Staufen homolog 2 isoform X2 [Nematostella vectensis]|uniref:double-stranded RNA-binding protein Staufen homolog 2 isoform X2 n=1 Tax=Nematostella vectensis TaxID=45351 RepID=UPI0020772EEE|nr:double-stranded RNA-binding protein Staufen homolog 2 isoform X2 [Nematostella vectensis]
MSQKTPISLMNELAKANNLNPEYNVIEETGPAHKKTFKVQLKLGDIGIWEGMANNIKLAKHKAAEKGLENCGLCMPEKKVVISRPVNLTPTVELNGLAMKLGKTTQYRELPPKPLLNAHTGQYTSPMGYHNGYGQIGYSMPTQHHQFNNHYNNHFNMYPRGPPRITRVSLTVGEQEFIGEGRDKQKARHDAAQKAMKVLREELLTQMSQCGIEVSGDLNETVSNGVDAGDEEDESDKSEISQVYEIATRMKMMVDFQDMENAGPAHMKKFKIKATVGPYMTEGEGNRKKDAKKEAAVKMLAELKKLPEPPVDPEKKKKYQRHGLYNAKKVKPKSDIDPTLNSISILGQILQRRHDPAPVYSLVEERGHMMKKEFTLRVKVGSHEALGVGPNKKTAKKNAAEAMLQLMGFRPTEGEKASHQVLKAEAADKVDATACNSPPTILGRQLKPGLLPMVPEIAKQLGCGNGVIAPIAQEKEPISALPPPVPPPEGALNRAPGAPITTDPPNPDRAIPGVTTPGPDKVIGNSFESLMSLAEKHGLVVKFTDYPKDNKGTPEFLSVCNVSCVPPITCYGSGKTIEESREEASANALNPLLEHRTEKVALSKPMSNGKEDLNTETTADVNKKSCADGSDSLIGTTDPNSPKPASDIELEGVTRDFQDKHANCKKSKSQDGNENTNIELGGVTTDLRNKDINCLESKSQDENENIDMTTGK